MEKCKSWKYSRGGEEQNRNQHGYKKKPKQICISSTGRKRKSILKKQSTDSVYIVDQRPPVHV